jgi:hypothetical protein
MFSFSFFHFLILKLWQNCSFFVKPRIRNWFGNMQMGMQKNIESFACNYDVENLNLVKTLLHLLFKFKNG